MKLVLTLLLLSFNLAWSQVSYLKLIGSKIKNGSNQLSDTLSDSRVSVGVGLVGQKINDEDQVRGVLFLNYDGYEMELNDESTLEIIPTNITVDFNGDSIQVFTNLTTYQYWGEESLLLMAEAISVDYKKNVQLKIDEMNNVSVLKFSATKFIPLDVLSDTSIDFYVKGGLGLLGKSRGAYYTDLNEHSHYDETTYGAGNIEVGLNLPLVNKSYLGGKDSNLMMYVGKHQSRGESLKMDRTYIGLELSTGKTSMGWEFTPFIDMVWDKIEHGSSQSKEYTGNIGLKLSW